jgi:hypothetical protein
MRPSSGPRAVRATQAVCPLTLTVALAFSVPGLAQAAPAPEPNSLAALVADVAEANQALQDVGARVQLEQESVNKAIVEVQAARDAAALAQQQVDASKQTVKDADAAIIEAQKRFDTFAAAIYVNGPSSALVLAQTPDAIIATASARQTLALSSQEVMAGLRQAQTTAVNSDAAARDAKTKADQAVMGAQTSQDAAVAALVRVQQTFREQQAEIDRLAAERKVAQQKLQAARAAATPVAASQAGHAAQQAPAPQAPAQQTPGPQFAAPMVEAAAPAPEAAGAVNPGDWDRAPGAAAISVPYGDPSEWDLTLPAVPSAFLSGDPVQIINAVLGIAQNSFQTTQQMGKKFLQQLGILKPTDTGITNNGGIPLVYGNRAIEHVISRAQSQIGVPYSWGGGNAAGKSRGIDGGANTVGFDCSGLVLYAFAGAGINLPHYSGSQYNMGRKIPVAQMRRGDALFWGPNGSQHVAIYLGNNQMIEAPYTGSFVKISPVRTSGMTPFAVRYIEW